MVKSAKGRTSRSSGRETAGLPGSTGGFTADEQAALRERARELKAARRRKAGSVEQDGETDVLARIAEMSDPDRSLAERLHALIRANAPSLSPRTWYGMPAYAKDGSVLCFFQSAGKFKTRYATLGFSDKARLDDGQMWPTSFALKELSAAEEALIIALLKKALG